MAHDPNRLKRFGAVHVSNHVEPTDDPAKTASHASQMRRRKVQNVEVTLGGVFSGWIPKAPQSPGEVVSVSVRVNLTWECPV